MKHIQNTTECCLYNYLFYNELQRRFFVFPFSCPISIIIYIICKKSPPATGRVTDLTVGADLCVCPTRTQGIIANGIQDGKRTAAWCRKKNHPHLLVYIQ